MDTNKIGSGEIVYPRTISPEPILFISFCLIIDDTDAPKTDMYIYKQAS